jgi:hypothetical protein
MTNALGLKTIQRLWVAILTVFVVTMTVASASPAAARSSFSLHVGVPLYAGPPAYYGPYYGGPYYPPYAYAPAPVYYAPPPVYYAPSATAAPNCSQGRWRQADGSIVNGIACLQPDGNWRLANY